MKKIAIIGCNSFLAKHLIEKVIGEYGLFLYGRTCQTSYLNKKEVVFIPFNYPETPLQLDNLLEYDTIIYTAAAGVQSDKNEPSLITYQINFYLPLQIVDFLNKNNYPGKLITFGSYFEIGDNDQIKAFDETEIIYASGKVPNIYCDSKRLLSRYYSNRQFEINWFHLMVPSLYGPGENENRLIPYIINGLKNNLVLKLSSGEQVRHYLYVSDLVDFISDIIESTITADLFNVVGDDQPIKIKNLVAMIYEMMGIKQPIIDQVKTRDQHMAYLSIDSNKIKKIGWQPKFRLTEGLKQYLNNSISNKIKHIERKKIEDSRGWFLKVINGFEDGLPNYTGEVYLTNAFPGEAKGGHYHEKANEWFTLLEGECELKLVDVVTGEKLSLELSSKTPNTIYVPHHIAHVFINQGSVNFTLMAYSDQLYSPEDTIMFQDF